MPEPSPDSASPSASSTGEGVAALRTAVRHTEVCGIRARTRPVTPALSAVNSNTIGSTCADLDQLKFKHRRQPLFPFEE